MWKHLTFATALLATSASAEETFIYIDADGGQWRCSKTQPGNCTLISMPPPAIDLRGLETGAKSA